MTKKEIQKIVDQLVSGNSEEEAYFGILYNDSTGEDESYIKANKQGLELFASELPKASRDAEEIINSGEGKIHVIGLPEEIFLSGNALIKYVEPSLEKRSQINQKTQEYSENWKDTVIKVGCLSLVGLFLLLAIIEIIDIISWIIN
jgi:hypothetical protein